MNSENIWYASSGKADSRLKWLVFEDIGRISVNNSSLVFNGGSRQIEQAQIEEVELTRQRFPVYSWALVAFGFIPIYFVLAFFAQAMFGMPLRIVFLFFCSFIIIGPIIGHSVKWVRIIHSDASGQIITSYFADGSVRGWRGIFGGTRTLFSDIQNALSLTKHSNGP